MLAPSPEKNDSYLSAEVAGLIAELSPKRDQRFLELMEAALQGKIQVYFAAVPLALCVPFDLDYRPDQHPLGASAIRETCQRWEKGQFQKMVAYQRGAWFVIADDYIPLFSALSGMPDYVPCWLLGRPNSDYVKDVQGPIALRDVPQILGMP